MTQECHNRDSKTPPRTISASVHLDAVGANKQEFFLFTPKFYAIFFIMLFTQQLCEFWYDFFADVCCTKKCVEYGFSSFSLSHFFFTVFSIWIRNESGAITCVFFTEQLSGVDLSNFQLNVFKCLKDVAEKKKHSRFMIPLLISFHHF